VGHPRGTTQLSLATGDSETAVTHLTLQGRFAWKTEGDKDPISIGEIGEYRVALCQHLSPPQTARGVDERDRITRLAWRPFHIGHPESILPDDPQAIVQLRIAATNHLTVEGTVLPLIAGDLRSRTSGIARPCRGNRQQGEESGDRDSPSTPSWAAQRAAQRWESRSGCKTRVHRGREASSS